MWINKVIKRERGEFSLIRSPCGPLPMKVNRQTVQVINLYSSSLERCKTHAVLWQVITALTTALSSARSADLMTAPVRSHLACPDGLLGKSEIQWNLEKSWTFHFWANFWIELNSWQKHNSKPQVIHTWLQSDLLTSCEVKSCTFVRSKSIIKKMYIIFSPSCYHQRKWWTIHWRHFHPSRHQTSM